jgi:hypothetical protein
VIRATAAAAVLFQHRETTKTYLAILEGHVDITRFPRGESTGAGVVGEVGLAVTAPAKPRTASEYYRAMVFEAKQKAQQGVALSDAHQWMLAVPGWSQFTAVARCESPTTLAFSEKKRFGKPKRQDATAPLDVSEAMLSWSRALFAKLSELEAADVARYRQQSKAVAVMGMKSQPPVVVLPSGDVKVSVPIASQGKDEFRMALGDEKNPGQVYFAF